MVMFSIRCSSLLFTFAQDMQWHGCECLCGIMESLNGMNEANACLECVKCMCEWWFVQSSMRIREYGGGVDEGEYGMRSNRAHGTLLLARRHP